jgi:D-alanine-D-alanine ligase-like ATP-grasp enzyme
MDAASGGVDWRAGYTSTRGIPQAAIETPSPLHDFCLAYLGELNLNFGCFDFIVDDNDTPWFLECNPNGQWMWIEEDTGLPISRAIAECLARGSSG